MNKKKIGLLIIATNKYVKFLSKIITSADKYFCTDHEVTYFVFSNRKMEISCKNNVKIIHIDHKDWPWMTLGRYEIFLKNEEELSKMDYLYYCDVDMKFVDEVGSEILGERVATHHPIYDKKRGTPETNPKSLAFISENEEMTYFAGGFNGGTATEYLKMAKKLSENIKKDFDNGIIAIWHDESHMNRYFIDNPPTIKLTPSYCYPESWNHLPYVKRLLALDKNHEEVRN